MLLIVLNRAGQGLIRTGLTEKIVFQRRWAIVMAGLSAVVEPSLAGGVDNPLTMQGNAAAEGHDSDETRLIKKLDIIILIVRVMRRWFVGSLLFNCQDECWTLEPMNEGCDVLNYRYMKLNTTILKNLRQVIWV